MSRGRLRPGPAAEALDGPRSRGAAAPARARRAGQARRCDRRTGTRGGGRNQADDRRSAAASTTRGQTRAFFPARGRGNTSWDASVNVGWPIFDGGRARSEIAEAAASARAARARLAEFDASIGVEIRQRLSEVVSSRAAIDAATDGVRSATEARRVIGERFAAGVAISTDVLDAQVALLQAELDRTQAVANARLADARLARALGQ